MFLCDIKYHNYLLSKNFKIIIIFLFIYYITILHCQKTLNLVAPAPSHKVTHVGNLMSGFEMRQDRIVIPYIGFLCIVEI